MSSQPGESLSSVIRQRPQHTRREMTDTEPQTAGGKVLWHFLTSLDGFVAGPNHEMDWMTGGDQGALSFLGPAGEIISGAGIDAVFTADVGDEAT